MIKTILLTTILAITISSVASIPYASAVTVDGIIGAGEYANSVLVDRTPDLGGVYDPGPPLPTGTSFAGGPVNCHDDWRLFWDSDATNIYIAADPLGAPSSCADLVISAKLLPLTGDPNTGVGVTGCTGTFFNLNFNNFHQAIELCAGPGFEFIFTPSATPPSSTWTFVPGAGPGIPHIEWSNVRADLNKFGDTTYTGDLQCLWIQVSAFDSRSVDNAAGPGSRTIWIKFDPATPPCGEESAADHYLGYKVKETKHTDKFQKFTVTLSDQFESDVIYTVEKPEILFNPVDKNQEGITDEITHLLGYKIKASKGDPKFEKVTNVLVENQFGQIIVDVKKPKLLLVPSLKDHDQVPVITDSFTINHFKCYDVKETKGTPKFVKRLVTLSDPNFGESKVFEVKKPKQLCTPVDKNGEGIIDAENHLMCYDLKKIKDEPKFEKRNVFTNNQFEPEDLEVKKEHQLCVPSTKEIL